MAIPAGSKGGYFGPLRETGADLVRFASDLPYYQSAHRLHTVRTLGLYVNTDCNLACEHCYYQIANGYRAAEGLPADRLIQRLAPALDTEVLLFAFVGKEVFLPGPRGAAKTLKVLEFLADARDHGRQLRLGAVTNGTHLDRSLPSLEGIRLDFLDISFDGPDAASHDALRGPGAFERSTRNLAKAVTAGVASKVFVASTLYRGNLVTLANILDFHDRFGVNHFSVMPIVAVQDDAQSISLRDLLEFVSRRLPEKASALPAGPPLQVVVDIDSYMVARQLDAFAALLEGTTVQLDDLNNVVMRRSLGRLELVLRISLPDPCNSYGCITHDGLYFDKGGCLFMKKGYERHALGSVASTPVDALIARHEARAKELSDRRGRELFSDAASDLVNGAEHTEFYSVPQLA